jgi:hypothetical protein
MYGCPEALGVEAPVMESRARACHLDAPGYLELVAAERDHAHRHASS